MNSIPPNLPGAVPGAPGAPSAAAAAPAGSFAALWAAAIGKTAPPHVVGGGSGTLAGGALAGGPEGLPGASTTTTRVSSAPQAARGHEPSTAPAHERGRDSRHPGNSSAKQAAHSEPHTLVDPSDFAPPTLATMAAPSSDTTETQRSAATLEDMFPELVRRIAWSGDKRKGAVRLEVGTGALEGAALLIQGDDTGKVQVHMQVPAGVDPDALRARIASGLQARGLAVDEIDIE